MQAIKKPGRPTKFDAPLSGKERAAMYRERRLTAALVAHEHPAEASTADLLAGLKRHITQIQTDPEHALVARDLATVVIRELCDRHGIKMPRQSQKRPTP